MRLLNVYTSVICVIAVSGAETEKRAPLGFTGVRGKKSVDESTYLADDSQTNVMVPDDALGVEKRAPSGFMGMRGKKPFEEWTPVEYPENLYKRAPSGFFGMRGKKDVDDFEIYEKRAPSGFMGMRGKKEFDEYMEKRVPSGFFGMRGKKDYDGLMEEAKRAPSSGFFGMRGKKQPARSGFFGMRGKKYPYEFRGKFVGVRGKKMSNEVVSAPEFEGGNLEEDLTRLGEGLDLNQLMLLLTENNSYDAAENPGYYAQK